MANPGDEVAVHTSGRRLTQEDVERLRANAANSLNKKYEDTKVSIPVYKLTTPMTRDELIDVFKASWPNADLGDVDSYLSHYKVPVASVIPYGPPPELPDDMEVTRRKSIMSEYEDNKHMSKRVREQFVIAGYPAYVPQGAFPSVNDTNEAIKAAKERIANVYVG